MKVFSRLWHRAKQHKVWTGILIIVLVWGGYYWRQKATSVPTETRYVLAAAAKGTIVSSVSGTGQVLASNQVDVKPKVSGDALSVPLVQGQRVRAGDVIARLDSTDAQKAVRDAETSLESAQLSMLKLKQSSADINVILENTFADISNAFLDFPSIVTSAQDVILGSTLNPRNQDNIGYYKDFVGVVDEAEAAKVGIFIDSAESDYRSARTAYDEVFLMYKGATRYSDAHAIEALLSKTIDATKALAQALKSEQNLLDYLSDYGTAHDKSLPSLASTYKSTLRTNIGLVNSHLSGLTGASNDIANAPLDIRSQEITIAGRENALADAKATLADYVVRAPFDGVVAKLGIKKGDSISAGTVIATMITTQRIAEITLNEVDIAKVAAGQKATLTFDALPDMTIAGSVFQLDSIGTASQGVVTYKVQIAFDTQDERIKPGMSVSAAVITETKQDVLVLPSSAIKAQGAISYVEVLPEYLTTAPDVAMSQGVTASVAPQQKPVMIGLGGDTSTEVVSGLAEGDLVITRIISSASTAASATSGIGGLRIPGITGGGSNNFRAVTGR